MQALLVGRRALVLGAAGISFVLLIGMEALRRRVEAHEHGRGD